MPIRLRIRWLQRWLCWVKRRGCARSGQPPVGLTAAENLHALHALEGRVENLHVYHRDREGACRPLAEGTADWQAYFAAAQKDGTQRYATLEFVMGDNEEQFLQDAAALHVLLKEE